MTKLEQLISEYFPQGQFPPLDSIEDLSYYLEDERKPEEMRRAYYQLLEFLEEINKQWK